MNIRFKTFSEFMNGIKLVNRPAGGIKIVCGIGDRYVLLESKFKPWNTPDTRRIFLVKMYLKEVLEKANPSKKIQRVPGFELLGKRCLYRDAVSIICDAVDMVDPDTGEMTKRLKIFNDNIRKPFSVFINNVQI
jgi:hypothetical protein